MKKKKENWGREAHYIFTSAALLSLAMSLIVTLATRHSALQVPIWQPLGLALTRYGSINSASKTVVT